jgi:hypothetical protein
MTLTINLTPEQEIRLRQEAAMNGMAADEYAGKLLTEGLSKEKPKINLYNPNVSPEELARNREGALALLRAWHAEDATDDPEEIRKAEEELAAFKKAINENRAGERPIYP